MCARTQAEQKKGGGEVLLDTGLSEEDELGCFGRKCVANDQCCRGSVCVDVDGSKVGTCLPVYGQREGEKCQQEADCERGLSCLQSRPGATRRVCQQRNREMRKKQFSEPLRRGKRGALHNEQVVDLGSADEGTSPRDKAIARSWYR
ncbi:hypothetical protein HPB52_011155 [Rhipicephalus sanguineus]|uniref:Dickkopf N-terminal cysteine-rich domain-containing protein n=1 Tax=Rhipicephalus sanguineus TaxID=34632 RepID=A0A9D4SUU6_RHISA|nr:hypothetical protein HPB52_011155 [Rhipicephalus sanguineus]